MREVTKIKVGGAEYNLRPTFHAYGDIESSLGKPMRELYHMAGTGMLTLAQTAEIVLIGMRQIEGQTKDRRTGADFTIDGIAQGLWDGGTFSAETINPVVEFIASLSWTPAQRKKIEAEVDKQMGEQTPT